MKLTIKVIFDINVKWWRFSCVHVISLLTKYITKNRYLRCLENMSSSETNALIYNASIPIKFMADRRFGIHIIHVSKLNSNRMHFHGSQWKKKLHKYSSKSVHFNAMTMESSLFNNMQMEQSELFYFTSAHKALIFKPNSYFYCMHNSHVVTQVTRQMKYWFSRQKIPRLGMNLQLGDIETSHSIPVVEKGEREWSPLGVKQKKHETVPALVIKHCVIVGVPSHMSFPTHPVTELLKHSFDTVVRSNESEY